MPNLNADMDVIGSLPKRIVNSLESHACFAWNVPATVFKAQGSLWKNILEHLFLYNLNSMMANTKDDRSPEQKAYDKVYQHLRKRIEGL